VTAQRAAGAAVGVVFGIVLCWSGMADPDVIRAALLFEQAYLFLFFASAVATAVVGLRILRRVRERALLNDAPIGWSAEPVRRRHLAGSVLFGIGWGVTGACPGPIAAQLGMGVPWAVVIGLGAVLGVWLHLRRSGADTEPACDVAQSPPATRTTVPVA
jgi:uncharacterized membrane protein YedE/YeeE